MYKTLTMHNIILCETSNLEIKIGKSFLYHTDPVTLNAKRTCGKYTKCITAERGLGFHNACEKPRSTYSEHSQEVLNKWNVMHSKARPLQVEIKIRYPRSKHRIHNNDNVSLRKDLVATFQIKTRIAHNLTAICEPIV
jgi:hypothetical protein